MNKLLNSKISINAGILSFGSVGSSLLGLISFSLMARSLDPYFFGIIALVMAYSAVIDKLFNFQSWQAIIKYGSDALENDDKNSLNDLIIFGFIIDVSTAVLATVISISIPFLIGGYIGWDYQKIQMASIFSIVILFNIDGAPTALLRMFDGFKYFVYKDFIVSLSKLVMVIIGYKLDMGVWYFLICIMISQILGSLYLLYASIKVGMRNAVGKIQLFNLYSVQETIRCYPSIIHFIVTTNFHGSVRLLTLNFDTIIVDTIFGSKETGLYQVVKQFSRVFTQVSQPFYKSIYPEFTKLKSEGNRNKFVILLRQFTSAAISIAVLFWFVFLFFGEYIVVAAVGEAYLDGVETLLWYLSGVALSFSAFAITPAVLALGYSSVAFKALSISTFVYFSSLFILVNDFGLVSFGMAYAILYVTWMIMMFYYYRKVLRHDLFFKLNT